MPKRMKKTIRVETASGLFEADVHAPGLDISLPLHPEGKNPNAYFADAPKSEPYRFGDFVGDLEAGGLVNYQKLSLSPHGNGTHTESLLHIAREGLPIHKCLQSELVLCHLLSLSPKQTEGGDLVVQAQDLQATWETLPTIPEALFIRTLPNGPEKVSKQYSGSNPPYLEAEIGRFLQEKDVPHLGVDLPSVDKEEDGGRLSCHKAFWNWPDAPRTMATITELFYAPEHVPDGLYLLNIQVMPLVHNASPSRLRLWPLKEIQ